MLFSAAPSCGWFAAMPRRTRASALTRRRPCRLRFGRQLPQYFSSFRRRATSTTLVSSIFFVIEDLDSRSPPSPTRDRAPRLCGTRCVALRGDARCRRRTRERRHREAHKRPRDSDTPRVPTSHASGCRNMSDDVDATREMANLTVRDDAPAPAPAQACLAVRFRPGTSASTNPRTCTRFTGTGRMGSTASTRPRRKTRSRVSVVPSSRRVVSRHEPPETVLRAVRRGRGFRRVPRELAVAHEQATRGVRREVARRDQGDVDAKRSRESRGGDARARAVRTLLRHREVTF